MVTSITLLSGRRIFWSLGLLMAALGVLAAARRGWWAELVAAWLNGLLKNSVFGARPLKGHLNWMHLRHR